MVCFISSTPQILSSDGRFLSFFFFVSFYFHDQDDSREIGHRFSRDSRRFRATAFLMGCFKMCYHSELNKKVGYSITRYFVVTLGNHFFVTAYSTLLICCFMVDFPVELSIAGFGYMVLSRQAEIKWLIGFGWLPFCQAALLIDAYLAEERSSQYRRLSLIYLTAMTLYTNIYIILRDFEYIVYVCIFFFHLKYQ